jgi:uncharacterized protein YlbG (UPF0298 family)
MMCAFQKAKRVYGYRYVYGSKHKQFAVMACAKRFVQHTTKRWINESMVERMSTNARPVPKAQWMMYVCVERKGRASVSA